ncbi:nicotinamide N-methyltransferase-like [Pelobates cultripes]|uniref:Nicotinamide N-methyltransferase-like n=1 Tax=Pelobates cultripes TaxID=61616 RepID=A0AAD1TC54_PELCU|nr:nicotinamide N-methyltransferase-like [Pelobates cultripes]
MDVGSSKLYQEPGFKSRVFLDTFFSLNTDKSLQEETLMFPMKQMHKALLSGLIGGDTLIDVTLGPIIHHLLPICTFFKNIIILEFNEECVKEMEKWLNTETEAFDWSHASQFITELGGNRVHWLEQEHMLKKTIKHIVKCDLAKENITDPVILPKADCLLIVGGLDVVSKDHESYRQNLGKLSSFLKPGGHLILFGALNATFYQVGEHRCHVLTADEPFLRQALTDEGYTIECFEALERKAEKNSINTPKVLLVRTIKDATRMSPTSATTNEHLLLLGLGWTETVRSKGWGGTRELCVWDRQCVYVRGIRKMRKGQVMSTPQRPRNEQIPLMNQPTATNSPSPKSTAVER